MPQHIADVSLLVRDSDEAVSFFTRSLGSNSSKTQLPQTARGVTNAGSWWHRSNSSGTNLLLAQASNQEEATRVGNQTGGRVFLFLHTDDFWRDYRTMTANGVKFIREPRNEPYGTVAVFEDLYG